VGPAGCREEGHGLAMSTYARVGVQWRHTSDSRPAGLGVQNVQELQMGGGTVEPKGRNGSKQQKRPWS
jgi:hypothetical protein